MSKELQFVIFCIEEYKNSKGMSGKEVINLFNKYSVLDYLWSFYEALHLAGTKYIVNIKSRQLADNHHNWLKLYYIV